MRFNHEQEKSETYEKKTCPGGSGTQEAHLPATKTQDKRNR